MDHRAGYFDTLPFEVRLTLFDVAAGSPEERVYRVHISLGVENARTLSMAQLAASRGGYAKVEGDARRLVANATNTKPSAWKAEVGDFLVTITRRAK